MRERKSLVVCAKIVRKHIKLVSCKYFTIYNPVSVCIDSHDPSEFSIRSK